MLELNIRYDELLIVPNQLRADRCLAKSGSLMGESKYGDASDGVLRWFHDHIARFAVLCCKLYTDPCSASFRLH